MKTQDLWVEGYPTSTNPLRFLWFTTRPHRPAAITTTVIVAFAAMLSASVTYLFKLIVNAATSLSNTHDYHALYLAAAWWIMVQLIGEWLWRLAAWFAASWADGVRATARDSLISYVTLHSSSYFSDHFAGSINNKISHAGSGIREMINLFLWNFMQFFVSIIAALYLSWTVSGMITGLLFGWIIIIVIINYYFVLWRTPRLYAAQEIETRITGRTVDLLTNITAMKEYARRAYELTTLRTLIDMRRKAGIFNWRSSEGMRAVNSFVQAFFAAGMLYVAVTQFSAGKITVKAVFIPSSGHIRLVDL